MSEVKATALLLLGSLHSQLTVDWGGIGTIHVKEFVQEYLPMIMIL